MRVSDQFTLFDRIREATGQGLARAVAELLPTIADDMRRRVDQVDDLRTEMALTEAALVLRDEIDIRTELAVATLDECHVRALQQPAAEAGSRRDGHGFALLSDVELSEQLLAAALAAKVRESLEEAYPAYLDRLAQLSGVSADDAANPLGARALASAVCAALRPYTTDALTRDAVEAALLRHAVVPLRQSIAATDGQMVEAGILSTLPRIVVDPSPRRAAEPRVPRTARAATTVVVAAPPPRMVESLLPARVAVPQPSAADRAPPAPPEPALASESPVASELPAASEPPALAASQSAPAVEVVAAARRIVGDVKASMVLGENPLDGNRDPRSAFRHASALPRVDALERDAIAFAHTVGQAPFSTPARKAFFGQIRRQMKTAGVPSAQLATLDVVAAMFDYATDSERIPEPAKPLLWRLQMPAVTLACLDAGYLGDEPRSIRRLVEHVAAIATAWPDELTRGSELHGRLQTVVRAVEVVAHAFQVRSQVLSEQVKREYQRATQGVGQLVSRVSRERSELEANAGRRNRRDYRRRPSREREMEVSARIEHLLSERLRDRDVPDSVGEFLKGVWLRHLRTAILRDGEESPSYQAALKVVDDLLWTLDGKGQGERQSRNELAQRIPDMLRILTQGISDIGARSEDYRAFFDEMFLIHLRRMQKRRKPSRGAAEEGADSQPEAGRPAAPGAVAGAARAGAAGTDVAAVVAAAAAEAVGTAEAAGGSASAAMGVDGPAAANDDDLDLPLLDLPVLETPIAGVPPARPIPAPSPAGTEGPAAPAPVSGEPVPPSFTAGADAVRAPRYRPAANGDARDDPTILPPAPPRESGLPDPLSLTDAGGWPELSEAFVDEAEAAVHGPRSAVLDPLPEETLRDAPPEPAAMPATGQPASPPAKTGRAAPDPDAQSASELKLRRLIDSTTLDDAPRFPIRMDLTGEQLGRDLAPGQWLEMITSSRRRILAKVAWINERRSVVLLLQHPDRLILSRHVAALMDRADRRRVFRVR